MTSPMTPEEAQLILGGVFLALGGLAIAEVGWGWTARVSARVREREPLVGQAWRLPGRGIVIIRAVTGLTVTWQARNAEGGFSDSSEGVLYVEDRRRFLAWAKVADVDVNDVGAGRPPDDDGRKRAPAPPPPAATDNTRVPPAPNANREPA